MSWQEWRQLWASTEPVPPLLHQTSVGHCGLMPCVRAQDPAPELTCTPSRLPELTLPCLILPSTPASQTASLLPSQMLQAVLGAPGLRATEMETERPNWDLTSWIQLQAAGRSNAADRSPTGTGSAGHPWPWGSRNPSQSYTPSTRDFHLLPSHFALCFPWGISPACQALSQAVGSSARAGPTLQSPP